MLLLLVVLLSRPCVLRDAKQHIDEAGAECTEDMSHSSGKCFNMVSLVACSLTLKMSTTRGPFLFCESTKGCKGETNFIMVDSKLKMEVATMITSKSCFKNSSG
jgi:hypothetical protein